MYFEYKANEERVIMKMKWEERDELMLSCTLSYQVGYIQNICYQSALGYVDLIFLILKRGQRLSK